MTTTLTAPRNSAVEARKKTMRAYTLERNRYLVACFAELYNKKRLRYDDVLEKLEKQFFISQERIVKIIKNPEI